MVVKLEACLARPPDTSGAKDKFRLIDHLVSVAEKCGNIHGGWKGQLSYLAGLMHDAGKARTAWQKYLAKGKKQETVFHSPLGSALLIFLAEELLRKNGLKGAELEEAHLMTLKLGQDIADHHGCLSDLGEENLPWNILLIEEHARETDLDGLLQLAREKLNIEKSPEEFFQWLKKYAQGWRRNYSLLTFYLEDQMKGEDKFFTAASFCMRKHTAELIAADRYHAAGVSERHMAFDEAKKAVDYFQDRCSQKAKESLKNRNVSQEIMNLRQQAQNKALLNFRNHMGQSFFSLFLPTGLGKTLTALRLGLEAVKEQDLSRIIYVAPYLAILSQAAREIEKITGLEVLQHHHLSLVEHQEIDDLGFLALESWQSPVVATTLNQLFLALFPRTAQQTMRLKGLENSFIIIDEPQIIDSQVWNMFLKMLRAAADYYKFKVLFTTATMPPTIEGLGQELVKVAPDLEVPDRYRCFFNQEILDQETLARKIAADIQEQSSVAAILNTIKDAYSVYKETKEALDHIGQDDIKLFFLSGCMTPIHKAIQIDKIRNSLASGNRTVVISTQILEAGVDLSFRKIFRALPIFPSIVQAAGRANRHGENSLSQIEIFVFQYDGEKDSRKFVYHCRYAREETSSIIETKNAWMESETLQLLDSYYCKVFKRNPNTASYQKIEEAAMGSWSKIAGTEPFAKEPPKIKIFTPWGKEHLDDKEKYLLNKFAPTGPEELYEKYLDPSFIYSLDFLEKKKFMALLTAFVVSIDTKYAYPLADVTSGKEITKIKDVSLYSDESGLSHALGGRDVSSRMI